MTKKKELYILLLNLVQMEGRDDTMFGIGMQELLVIAIVALLIVGPKKLPGLAKTLGKSLSEFRKTADGLTDDLKDTVKTDDDTEEAKPSPVAEYYEPKDENSGDSNDSAPFSEEASNSTESSDAKTEIDSTEK